jgi:hypothetical protein
MPLHPEEVLKTKDRPVRQSPQNRPLHPEEVLETEDKQIQSSPCVTSFFLPHDSLGVGERGFGQVVTQLH